MKVKELIKLLEGLDEDAYVHVQTDARFEEDVRDVIEYSGENADVVLISSIDGWKRI